MPYGETPWVRDGYIRIPDSEWIKIDTPEWFAWVEQVTSFCYSSPHSWMRLTVRKEKRGTNFYWYGYRKIDSKLHNVYLGKGEQLTQDRLEEACERILQRLRERRTSAATDKIST